MRMSRWWCVLGSLVLVLGLSAEEPAKVTTRVIKYDGLKEVVKQLKGKVVVVDFWMDS